MTDSIDICKSLSIKVREYLQEKKKKPEVIILHPEAEKQLYKIYFPQREYRYSGSRKFKEIPILRSQDISINEIKLY